MALDRVEKALAMVDRNGQGLEIGPSFSPMAPKREGFNVHVVDYLNGRTCATSTRTPMSI